MPLLALRVTKKVFTPCLGVLHVMWGAWCMISPWLVGDGHRHVEVACSYIARPCMDAYVAFFLGALETLGQLGDILHDGHIWVGCLLVGTPFF